VYLFDQLLHEHIEAALGNVSKMQQAKSLP
jgi:hypothetical protein